MKFSGLPQKSKPNTSTPFKKTHRRPLTPPQKPNFYKKKSQKANQNQIKANEAKPNKAKPNQ